MRWRVVGAIAVGLAVMGYLATGLVVVAPGEAVVVRRLGRALPRPWTTGPHWGWPAGFDRVTRVRVDEVRRIDVGLAQAPGPEDEPGAGEFLTGDLNLIRARGVVQYRIADPVAFALRADDVEGLLGRLAESSLARALSRRGIDAALRSGRAELARAVEQDLASAAGRQGLGVSILSVSLTDARPPAEVQAEFAAAQSAQAERDRRVNEAKSHEVTALTAAGAEAQSRRDRALAAADRARAVAKARAERFLALRDEAGRSRALTVRRIYLETLRDLLPRIRRKVLLTPDEPVDLSLFGIEK
jgi:membrane protease subunit HflK